ncbi:hypothetical protein BJ912DRAFT_961658 [Pholiota molesta]|nr:hypothetical protein BJ912DRAFT_961658 [Pholiota molesta]
MSSGPPPDFSRIAGPLFLGYLLNWGLFGVLSVQVYFYHIAFSKDRLEVRFLVYGDYLIESLQTFIFTQSAFRTFATGFGDVAILDDVGTVWFSVCVLTGLVAFIAQTFYAYRIKVLSQKPYLAALVMLFATVQFASAITSGVQLKLAKNFSHFINKQSLIVIGFWQGSSALCDVLIAASMSYYLRSRQASGVPETRNLVARIIRLTVGTGVLTATIAVVSLILNFLPGSPTYYQTAISALAKLYSNSMMVVFNSRRKISDVDNSTSEYPVPLTSVGGTMHTHNPQISRHGGILVTREEMNFGGDGFEPNTDIKNPRPDVSDWK